MKIQICTIAILLAPLISSAAEVVDLATFPPEKVWRCANSHITAANDKDGSTMWRWEIGSGEGFLWLSEELPIHARLQQFDRIVYDVKFAEGQIELFWPRTMGVLRPPFDKMFCEWNLFYFTHPHKQWITYQQMFDDPSWFAHWASQIPQEIQLDRSHLLGFACLAKGPSCVVELRHCRLVRDSIRVEKPYLTTPIGWPVREDEDGVTRYRTPYFVRNVSAKAIALMPRLASQHQWFKVDVQPAQADVPAGQTRRFDVVATVKPDAPALAEETAIVEFIPDGDAALAFRTETFCTAPLPKDVRRMVACSSQELSELKREKPGNDAEFWTSVRLEGESDIPAGIGHMLVAGMPIECPQCKTGHLHVTSRWLEVKCDRCDHTERHTKAADATWIATWSEIHGAGPDPTSLGRAYLATGEERYAQKAIALLTLLASRYGQLPWHNAGDPRGWDHAEPPSPDASTNGASARWGNSPTYGTNLMVQRLAALHDMIVDSPSWTEPKRKAVHDGLWVPVATELIKIVPGISNMNDIINRDLILAAFATGDANMLYRATMYPAGLIARLKDISPDGFSDEASALNYHFSGMREWFPSIELLMNSHLRFGDITERAVAALKMPLLRAGLNGLTYCTGNSGGAWFDVPLDHPMFQLADRLFPPDVWPRPRHYSTQPVLFRDGGWAVLRSGDTVETQVEVNLDFGRSHGHGDLDRMNLGLQAFGVPLSADPGSSYNYNTNAVTGPAVGSMDGPFCANTVVVDGQPQLRGAGELVRWDPSPAERRVSARTTGVYPGVSWQRSVVLVDNVTIVVDDLKSQTQHLFESAWHHYGRAAAGEGCSFVDLPSPLGGGPHQQLLNPRGITGEVPRMNWLYRGVHVRLWQPAESGQLTFTAQTGACWDNVKGLAVDGFFARREGSATRFVTVLEPYRTTPPLSSVVAEHRETRTTVTLNFRSGASKEVNVDDQPELPR